MWCVNEDSTSVSSVHHHECVIVIIPYFSFTTEEEEAKDQVSKAPGTKGGTVPAEPDGRQRESTEIRNTVKAEDDKALKGEKDSNVKQSGGSQGWFKFLHPLKATQEILT